MKTFGLMALVGGCVLAACVPVTSSGPEPVASEPYDVVLEGGRIVDGGGSPWFYGDVAIKGDRIVRVTPPGLLRASRARERLDVNGLVVAPGFIDIQSQSTDAFLTGDGRSVSKISQGITTEILGEGSTPAPSNDSTRGHSTRPADGLSPRFDGPNGFDDWLTAMERRGVSPNVGSFVGAATVRTYVMGRSAALPDAAQLDSMRAVTRRAMEGGAFGVASALIYPPGSYASTGELIELAKTIAPYGGVYISHVRSEGEHLIEAIDEALEIGLKGGVPVEIYHLKAAGVRNWFKAAQVVAKIDSARAAGFDIRGDMYAYLAGGTGLTACMPPWSAEGGRLLQNLRDSVTRAKIHAEMLDSTVAWENMCQLATPAGVMVLGLRRPEDATYAGKRLQDIAAVQGKDWADAAIDLVLREEQRVEAVYFHINEANLTMQLRKPWATISTDAGGVDPDSAKILVHPRAYGNYPRVLGRYVREQGVLTLEDAIRKMTSAVAARLSLQRRGLIREGMYADIVAFDPTTIIDRATYEQPHQLSSGVRYVFVNGVMVLRDGRHTGATPGRALRGPGYRRHRGVS